MKQNSDWNSVRNSVRKRDKSCRLCQIIINEYLDTLKKNAEKLFYILDCAHVFGRGSNAHLKFEIQNIVLLNRYSHSMLDQQKHPINGHHISKVEHRNWWKAIVGETLYAILERAAQNRSSKDL